MEVIKPRQLKTGDTLGIIACSTPISGCSVEARERGYQRLRELGFKLIEAPNCATQDGHSAGSIRARVDALHAMFLNQSINGIISFWGGMQSHQLLEYLDFELIKRNPKPLIGYSDTTALQVGIHSQTGLITFSGPSVISFAKPELPDYTLEHFVSALVNPQVPLKAGVSKSFSDNPWYKDGAMIFRSNPGLKVFREGVAEGRAMGGNIGTMLLLAGTKYWPDLQGRILFFEDDEAENPKTIDRMFTHLRQIGVFGQISGLIVGRFPSSVGFNESDSLELILHDALKGYDFPVLTGADFGHTDPLMTIPLGARTRMDAGKQLIEFLEAGVI